MTFDTEIREMFCPKCDQRFEEGSRRFCPSDGTRLVLEAAESDETRSEAGIFSHLLPKTGEFEDRDETLADVPRFVMNEPSKGFAKVAPKSDDESGPFFEIGDVQPDDADQSDFLDTIEMNLADSLPTARKINPYEIPPGHVDLGDESRAPAGTSDFNGDDPESFVGRTVKGRYYVTELFEEDEAGFAYLADDQIVENKKVLVHILLVKETDDIMAGIYAEERVALSHLTHPNIARLIDSGQFTDGTSFLISEYVDALSVRDILSIHGQFDHMRAARVIREAAYALTEAHQDGVLHRDLKPENIILNAADGETEHLKLIAFGVSNGKPTSENLLYKAPEVLDGRLSTIASDTYALSVVAFEMLTGRAPFQGSGINEILKSQRAGLLLHPTTLRPELPSAVDGVFAKALSFNAVDRYANARDFGDAFFAALTDVPSGVVEILAENEAAVDSESDNKIPVPPVPDLLADDIRTKKEVTLKPLVKPKVRATEEDRTVGYGHEPAWKQRSPEPLQTDDPRSKIAAAAGILVLVLLLAFGLYYFVNRPAETEIQTQTDQAGVQTPPTGAPPVTSDIEVPPLPRKIAQPPDTAYYQNIKQNLKGDLLRNFVGFSMYYPKDWKVNGPQESAAANARGKFLDISKTTPDGRPKEQMLISYYPSKGTFANDAVDFPQMVRETNETLKKIVPNYQVLSEGEIRVNGAWRAYEVKFQGGGTSGSGEKLVLWGRRLFIPAARPGARNGFEITMLATSLADDVRSVDDVGVRGELAAILDSFEPSQNF